MVARCAVLWNSESQLGPAHCTPHSTQHTMHYTLHTTQYTQHTTHYTLQVAYYTLQTTYGTLHTACYIMIIANYTPYTIHYTLHTEHYALHITHYILNWLLAVKCSVLYYGGGPSKTHSTAHFTSLHAKLHWTLQISHFIFDPHFPNIP